VKFKLDWTQINWTAAVKSNMVRGGVAALICWGAMKAGMSLPPDQQTKYTNDLIEVLQDAIPVFIGYVIHQRAIAQPGTVATIVPKKPDTPPPAQ
jgi:hypothetical protein